MEAVECENYKRSAPGKVEILACTIALVKKVAVSKSREIARVAYLGQITNIGSCCARKFEKERSQEEQDISVGDKLLEIDCRLRIARNRSGRIFRSNNEYWKQSRSKVINGALQGGPGY